MNYYTTMTQTFEKEKNRQAALITGAFATALVIVMFIWKWKLPELPALIPQGEFIEVNLGVDDFGSGTDQPMTPGEPAPQEKIAYTPSAPEKSTTDDAKDVEEDETQKEAPKILKPTVVKPQAKEINKENKVAKVTPVPTPPAPQPQLRKGAQMTQTRGGNGSGGNGAESYQKETGEGIAGGKGDQGVPGGSPNGKVYTGAPRRLNNVRTVSLLPRSFEDDFNENGFVALDITVNDNGRLVSSSFQPRGSTISNRSQIDIAKKRAAQIDYPKYEGGFTQTIRIEFKVKG